MVRRAAKTTKKDSSKTNKKGGKTASTEEPTRPDEEDEEDVQAVMNEQQQENEEDDEADAMEDGGHGEDWDRGSFTGSDPVASDNDDDNDNDDDDDNEDDNDDDAETESSANTTATKSGPQKIVKKKSHALSKKRSKAFRRMAHQASVVTCGGGNRDAVSFILSQHDVLRLFRWTPTAGNDAYSSGETKLREDIVRDLRITPNALQVAQVHIDSLLRAIYKMFVRSIHHTKRVRIAPSTVAYCLAPYAKGGEFTAVTPPAGLIHDAKTKGVLIRDENHVAVTNSVDHSHDSSTARLRARAANKAEVRQLAMSA
jgi:hypothetical protein